MSQRSHQCATFLFLVLVVALQAAVSLALPIIDTAASSGQPTVCPTIRAGPATLQPAPGRILRLLDDADRTTKFVLPLPVMATSLKREAESALVNSGTPVGDVLCRGKWLHATTVTLDALLLSADVFESDTTDYRKDEDRVPVSSCD